MVIDNSLADGRENDEAKEININLSDNTEHKHCFKHGKGKQNKAQQKINSDRRKISPAGYFWPTRKEYGEGNPPFHA